MGPQVSPGTGPVPAQACLLQHPAIGSCTVQSAQPRHAPSLDSWVGEGARTPVRVAPRGACSLPFSAWQRQLSGLPPTSARSSPPPRGRRHVLPKPRCAQLPGSGALAGLLPPGLPGSRELLTSHQILVRQSRGGFRRRGGWEQGHSSRERRVRHLQDQRGLEQMGVRGQQVSAPASDHRPPPSFLFLSSLHQGRWL